MSYFSAFGSEPDGDRQHPSWASRAEPGKRPKPEAALAAVNRDLMAALPGQDALVLLRTPSWEPAPRSAIAEE